MIKWNFLIFIFLSIFQNIIGNCGEKSTKKTAPLINCINEWKKENRSHYKKTEIIKRCILLARKTYQNKRTIENQNLYLKVMEIYSHAVGIDQRKILGDFYKKYLTTFNLIEIKGSDLDKLFDTYQTISFYFPNEELADRLADIFTKIEKSRPTTETEKENLLKSLIKNRRWDKVQKFQAEFKMPVIDPITLSNLRSLTYQYKENASFYELSPSGNISLKQYQPPEDYSVIVISSINCHFSYQAMKEIALEKEFRDFFVNKGIFITSQNGFLELENLIKWNIENSATPIRIVSFEKYWPSEINWSGTPTFVFFKGKKYSHSIQGWDRDQMRKNIRRIKSGITPLK